MVPIGFLAANHVRIVGFCGQAHRAVIFAIAQLPCLYVADLFTIVAYTTALTVISRRMICSYCRTQGQQLPIASICCFQLFASTSCWCRPALKDVHAVRRRRLGSWPEALQYNAGPSAYCLHIFHSASATKVQKSISTIPERFPTVADRITQRSNIFPVLCLVRPAYRIVVDSLTTRVGHYNRPYWYTRYQQHYRLGQKPDCFLIGLVDNFATLLKAERHVICQKFPNFLQKI